MAEEAGAKGSARVLYHAKPRLARSAPVGGADFPMIVFQGAAAAVVRSVMSDCLLRSRSARHFSA